MPFDPELTQRAASRQWRARAAQGAMEAARQRSLMGCNLGADILTDVTSAISAASQQFYAVAAALDLDPQLDADSIQEFIDNAHPDQLAAINRMYADEARIATAAAQAAMRSEATEYGLAQREAAAREAWLAEQQAAAAAAGEAAALRAAAERQAIAEQREAQAAAQYSAQVAAQEAQAAAMEAQRAWQRHTPEGRRTALSNHIQILRDMGYTVILRGV